MARRHTSAGWIARMPAAPAASDAHLGARRGLPSQLDLKVPGVPGESAHPGFTNQIELFSFSWGESAPPGAKPTLSSLSLQAQLDRSTPLLESSD